MPLKFLEMTDGEKLLDYKLITYEDETEIMEMIINKSGYVVRQLTTDIATSKQYYTE